MRRRPRREAAAPGPRAAGYGLWALPAGRLILASASPRRRLLLRQQGLRFRVVVPRVPEVFERGETPSRAARRLALAKAEAVAKRFPRSWVLAADTVVAVAGRLLAKPESRREAEGMLALLSGRRHQVVTALALVGPGFRRAAHRTTGVWIRKLSAAERRAYAATREPYDKAGGYALQGLGALLVERIAGDWSNVVGLPLGLARDLFAAAATAAPEERPAAPARVPRRRPVA